MTVEIDGANNIVKTNTISEVTSANGVTVDGLSIKDSKLVTANSVIQTNITDQAINEAKMQISNAPTNGYALTAQSGNTGGLTWASVGGTNTPAFSAYKDSADQSLSGGGDVKVQYETEIFDSNGKYDTSNYRFTPTVSGKYFFMASAYVDTTGGVGTLTIAGLKIKKNGTTASKQRSNFDNNSIRTMTQQISCILDLDADDYVEAFAHAETTSGNGVVRRENIEGSNFIGFKLIT